MQLLPNCVATPFALQRLSNLEIGGHNRKLRCKTHLENLSDREEGRGIPFIGRGTAKQAYYKFDSRFVVESSPQARFSTSIVAESQVN